MAVELGELISLHGFSEDPAEMVIIKKLVGNHFKHFSERLPDVRRLELTQTSTNGTFSVHGKLVWDENDAEAENADSNLFFALDGCLKQLQRDAWKA